MKTILVPSDFSSASFKCIPELCSNFENEPIKLLFVHLFRMSDSIGDLLMLSRRSREYEYVSDDFYAQCDSLRATFENIRNIKIEFFYGSTLSTFKNFLEANEVSHILHPDLCICTKLNKASVSPQSLVTRCGLPLLHTNSEQREAAKPADRLKQHSRLAETMA